MVLERGRNGKSAMLIAHLRDEITRGERPPGQQMPTFAEMRRIHGIAPPTTDRIYSQLEREGLVVRANGKGIFVSERRRARTGVVGFTCARALDEAGQRSPYFGPLVEGVQSAALDAGYEVLLLNPESSIRWERVDGVLASLGFSPELAGRLPVGMPFVSLLMDWVDAPSFISDDFPAMCTMTRHLLDLGHQRVAIISAGTENYAQKRYEAYRQTMVEAGFPPRPEWRFQLNITKGSSFEHSGYDRMRLWLAQGWAGLGCTAIMAYNDGTAYGVIRALEEAGFSVPGDVSVTGFDGAAPSPGAPLLTTVAVPLTGIGRVAFEELKQWMEMDIVPVTTSLPARFIPGQTTAPVPVRPLVAG